MTDILRYFAEYLAKLIDKDPLLCKGLIRLALKEQYQSTYPPITFNSLYATFRGQLKSRLESMNYKDTEEVIQKLLNELTQIQSVLSIGTV